MGQRKFKPRYGSHLAFPGTQNIIVPDSSALSFTSAFSVIVSLKLPTHISNQRGIFGTTDGGASGNEMIVDANENYPRVTLRGTTTKDYTTLDKAVFRNGEWFRTALTVDHTNGLKIHTNGIFRDSGGAASWVGVAGGNFYIGDRGSVGLGDFIGGMSDMLIYDRELTLAEVEEDYFDYGIHDGLAAHWKMDEGSGTDLLDSSGNGYNATFDPAITYVNEAIR